MLREKLNAIRVILGMKVALEEAVLVDGVTKVKAEKFEPGFEISVVAEDGTESPAPEGVHETETMKITVDANGVISAVEMKEEDEKEVEVEVEAAEQPADIDALITEKLTPVFDAIEALVAEVMSIKEEVSTMKDSFSKFSKEPAGNKVPKITKSEEAIDPVMARIEALKKFKK